MYTWAKFGSTHMWMVRVMSIKFIVSKWNEFFPTNTILCLQSCVFIEVPKVTFTPILAIFLTKCCRNWCINSYCKSYFKLPIWVVFSVCHIIVPIFKAYIWTKSRSMNTMVTITNSTSFPKKLTLMLLFIITPKLAFKFSLRQFFISTYLLTQWSTSYIWIGQEPCFGFSTLNFLIVSLFEACTYI